MYFPHCSLYISHGADKENLTIRGFFSCQDFLLFCAVMFDSGVMVLGEVKNQSISGPEGFILFPLNFSEITHPVAQIETEVP